MPPEPRTSQGRQGLAALLAHPELALVAFDYDGTLAPIVDDPSSAVPEPGLIGALADLATRVAMVAIVTGRPAQLAVELAGLADHPRLAGLVVVGHYGLERWEAATGRLHTQEAPPGVDQARRELPGLLASLDLTDADIEDKGLSVAVHVRRLPDPARAFDVLLAPLTELAQRSGLAAEPGRHVVELRPPGMDKGQALRRLADDGGATTVMFTGDDLGDLAAFAEVGRMRSEGRKGLLVCSGSMEETRLADEADLVVDGPRGVLQLVTDLNGELDALEG